MLVTATLMAIGLLYAFACRLMRVLRDDQAQSEALPDQTQITTNTIAKFTTDELLNALEQLRDHDIPHSFRPQFMLVLRALRNYQYPFTQMVKQLFIEGLWINDNDAVDLDDYITKAMHRDELAKVENQRDALSRQLDIVREALHHENIGITELEAKGQRIAELEIFLEATTEDLRDIYMEKLNVEEAQDKLQCENEALQTRLSATVEALESAEKVTRAAEQSRDAIDGGPESLTSDHEDAHVSQEELKKLQTEILMLKQDRDSKISAMDQLHQQELQKLRAGYDKLEKASEAEISSINLRYQQAIDDLKAKHQGVNNEAKRADETTKAKHQEEVNGLKRNTENIRNKIRNLEKMLDETQDPCQARNKFRSDEMIQEDVIIEKDNISSHENWEAQYDNLITPNTTYIVDTSDEVTDDLFAQQLTRNRDAAMPPPLYLQRKGVTGQGPMQALDVQIIPPELVPNLTVAQVKRFRTAVAARPQQFLPLTTPIYTCHWKCNESFSVEDYPTNVWEHALKCHHCKDEGKPVACSGCGKIFLDNKTFRTQHGRLCSKGQLPASLALEHERKQQEIRTRDSDALEREKLPAHEKPCWNERDGRSCTNPNCLFKHSIPRPLPGTNISKLHDVQCKFEREHGICTKGNCPFKHAQPPLLKREVHCRFEQKFGGCYKKTCIYQHKAPRTFPMKDQAPHDDSTDRDRPSYPLSGHPGSSNNRPESHVSSFTLRSPKGWPSSLGRSHSNQASTSQDTVPLFSISADRPANREKGLSGPNSYER
jgi:hypothetical protein